MRDIILKTPTVESVIHCGEGAFEKYAPKLCDRQLFIITDSNVKKIYGNLLNKTFPQAEIFTFPAGEESKNEKTLLNILGAMAESGLKRSGTVLAFGGGVTGDIAGLSASLYMRGVRLVQVPTTLLSQVDSSVGGKTAVDFKNIKNLIGTFYQPEEVIVDPMFFKTLPDREINCGLGEIIKYGALDSGIYKTLLKADNLKDHGFLCSVTADCINHKAEVVTKDERDINGVRKTLNLGHTTGHTFELNYGGLSHGEFVLIGMYYEMYIAEKLGIGGGEYFKNIRTLIKKVIDVPAYGDIEKSAESAKLDKKNEDKRISLIVPEREGKSAELKLDYGEYVKLLNECANTLKGEK